VTNIKKAQWYFTTANWFFTTLFLKDYQQDEINLLYQNGRGRNKGISLVIYLTKTDI
jgi:hypothetical protein